MIYNIVFVSGIQQSESLIYVYIYLLFFFYSHISHYRVLSRVLSATQQVISYIIYVLLCICHTQTPNLSLFCQQVHLYLFLLYHFSWVWVSSRSWWWTGMPGMLQSMRSERVRHHWATELNWTLPFSLDSTYKWYHWIFFFLCLSQFDNL